KDKTIGIYEELFSEDPTDAIATEKLEELYRAEGKRAELLVMRERQIAVASSSASRVELRFELATLLADASEPAQALARLRENLHEAPDHAPTATKLAALLEQSSLFDELTAHLEEQAARARHAGDDAAAAALWQRAAGVAEARLGDPVRAIENHTLAADAGGAASLDELARLYTKRGDHVAAAQALDRLLATMRGEASRAVALRLADSLLAAGDRDTARARLAVAARGVDAPLLRKRLADLHKEAGDYRALADLLAEDATFATDKTTRATLLAQASELYVQRCDDPAAAVPLLEQARELAPDELAPKLALSSALAASRRLDEASRLLADIIASYGGRRPKERALVHHYLARVSLVAGDRARALGELDVALRIDPAHPEILHALARLAFEEGQIERADRTYRALLLVVRRPRESTFSALAVSRAEVLLELATIADKKEDPARAAEYLASAFEAARDEDSERERLLSALRVGKRHDLLARALQDRVTALDEGVPSPDAAAGASELASLLGELASLHEGPLERPDAALDARLRALSLTPDAESAREAALALARKTDTVGRFVDAARAVLDAATTSEQTIDRLLWLGRVLELDAKDDRGAAAAYARAETELAGDGAEAALGPASARSSPRVRRLGEVWRALERIHARLGDHAAQADVLSKRIAASAGLSPEEQADPLYRLAALRLGDVDAQAEGLDVLERALAVSSDLARAEALLRDALAKRPDDRELLRFFERFAREQGQRRALVDALVALAEEARRGAVPLEPGEDPLREAVDVALSLADRALAESILRRVLEASGEDAATAWAMIALAHLVEEAGNLAEAAALRERAAPHFDPEEERQLLIGVAEAATGPLADLDRAARIYEALRVREPADRDLWQPLLEVVRKRGDERRLASLLEETTPLVDDAKERAVMGFERARLVAKWDERAAASLLHEVLENDPSQVEAAMQLANMLERAGEKGELADLLRKQLEAAKDREDTASIVSLSIRLGALLEAQGEENEAQDVYHAALDWDKGAREILRAVLRIAHARDDSMDVGDALDQLLQVEIGEAAAELALQLAQIR
ncbi:MAG TPA: tetratricopeptide repeat protein, partial [Byssovorax sp.]